MTDERAEKAESGWVKEIEAHRKTALLIISLQAQVRVCREENEMLRRRMRDDI